MYKFYSKYKSQILRSAFGLFLGGVAGFAYYYYIGCANGCALQSNPYLMTGYGAMVGVTLLFPSSKKIASSASATNINSDTGKE